MMVMMIDVCGQVNGDRLETRDQALHLGQQLWFRGVFQHVKDPIRQLEDNSNTFYRIVAPVEQEMENPRDMANHHRVRW